MKDRFAKNKAKLEEKKVQMNMLFMRASKWVLYLSQVDYDFDQRMMELREEEEKQKEYRKNLKRKRKPEPEPEEMVQNLPLSEFFPACKVRRLGGWSRHDGNDGILGFRNFFQENLMAWNSWHIDLWAVTSYMNSIVIVFVSLLWLVSHL